MALDLRIYCLVLSLVSLGKPWSRFADYLRRSLIIGDETKLIVNLVPRVRDLNMLSADDP